MSKFVKRTLAIVLALSMCLALAACGEKSGSGNGAESYYVGFNTWGAGSATFDVMGDEIAHTLDVYGAESFRASDDHMADKELENIQNFISAEVDGIVMQISSDPVLPEAAKECEDAGIPFVLAIFTGSNEDREEIAANNSVYVGSVSADMVLDGYLMGKAAIEDGHKTAILIGGNVGHLHMDMRTAGFTKAFVEEGGGVILDSARCSSPAEGQEKANAILSAYPDADCMYAMVGDYVPGAINAMDALNLEIPLYVSNSNRDTVEYIRNGRIAAASSGNDLAAPVATALLINYLDGHPMLDENGNPPALTTNLFSVNKDNLDAWEEIFFADGNHPLTEERLNSLVWRENPDVTYETFVDFIENKMSLESMLADHGM